MTIAETQREELSKQLTFLRYLSQAFPNTTRILQVVGLILLFACLILLTVVLSKQVDTETAREESIKMRKEMQASLNRIEVKQDSILANQALVKQWHYEGWVRSVQTQVKLDSLKSAITKEKSKQ
jgi:hypothetical protein